MLVTFASAVPYAIRFVSLQAAPFWKGSAIVAVICAAFLSVGDGGRLAKCDAGFRGRFTPARRVEGFTETPRIASGSAAWYFRKETATPFPQPLMSSSPPDTDASTDGEAALDDLSFADALERLEALVERLDDPDDPPPLEEALDAYEEGTTLARECMKRLDDAELRVERLSIDE